MVHWNLHWYLYTDQNKTAPPSVQKLYCCPSVNQHAFYPITINCIRLHLIRHDCLSPYQLKPPFVNSLCENTSVCDKLGVILTVSALMQEIKYKINYFLPFISQSFTPSFFNSRRFSSLQPVTEKLFGAMDRRHIHLWCQKTRLVCRWM